MLFGREQWGVGPAVVVGYRTEAATFGAFGQYYFGVGSTGDREPGVRDASYLNLLYFLSVNLPNAWQFGFSPTITYDARASSGNQWNVPVGLMVAKTTLLGKLPSQVQLRCRVLGCKPGPVRRQSKGGARGDSGDSGPDPPLDSGR